MSYAIVHPTCYNKEGHCLHWVQSTVDDAPVLEFGNQIQSDDLHFKYPSQSQLDNKCGNPWNDLSDEYSQTIKTDCPKIQQPPTHGQRPITHITILENLKFELIQDIGADCWSVYTRNASTHVVTHIYFFQPHSGQDQAEQNKRQTLIDNPIKLIDDLNQGLQVCCSFGCYPFMDVYYQNVSQPNQTNRYIKISSIN